MPAFQQLPAVPLHHWWRVDEHLCVLTDILVQPRSSSDYDSPLCSSRSLMQSTWSQQDTLHNGNNYIIVSTLLPYDHITTVQTIRYGTSNYRMPKTDKTCLIFTPHVLRSWRSKEEYMTSGYDDYWGPTEDRPATDQRPTHLPSPTLEYFKWPYFCNGSSAPPHDWFYVRVIGRK